MTGTEDDAQDVYQEGFLKAYRHIGNFRFECSFYTWIYRIVTNLCLDHLRKRQTRKEEPTILTDSSGGGDDLPKPVPFDGFRANPAPPLRVRRGRNNHYTGPA